MNYLRKKPICLKQVYTFQSNQIKFENPISSIPSKIFTVLLLTTLNPRKPNVKWKCTSRIWQILVSTTKILHVYYVNIGSYETLEKTKTSFKPDKGNGVVILDRKLCDNVIQKIILDTSQFEKLDGDPTLKREPSLQRFLRKLKQKNFFTENEYNKLYPSGSAPARIYGTPEMRKFSSSD